MAVILGIPHQQTSRDNCLHHVKLFAANFRLSAEHHEEMKYGIRNSTVVRAHVLRQFTRADENENLFNQFWSLAKLALTTALQRHKISQLIQI